MDEKVLELKKRVVEAKARRDAAARWARSLEQDIARALRWSGASSAALTVLKEAVIGIVTSAMGIGIARSIQNSVRVAKWFKEGSSAAGLLLHHAQRIGSLAAEWLVNGARGDLRGAVLGSVANFAKSERAGAVLALCLATSDSAFAQATQLAATLRAKGPGKPPPELGLVPKLYGQQKDFNVLWKAHYEQVVEHQVWSRCYEIHEQLFEIYLAETLYPDPIHPVPALRALEEAVEKNKTGDDAAFLDWMTTKVEALVDDIRAHGMPVRKPYEGETPFARLALIYTSLEDQRQVELMLKFRRYFHLRGRSWDGMYEWWVKEGRAELRELLQVADHRFRRQGTRPPFPVEDDDEAATSGN